MKNVKANIENLRSNINQDNLTQEERIRAANAVCDIAIWLCGELKISEKCLFGIFHTLQHIYWISYAALALLISILAATILH